MKNEKSSVQVVPVKFENKNAALKEELHDVRNKLEKSESERKADKGVIAILEEKVQNSEAKLYDYCEKHKKSLSDKAEEMDVLKRAIKKNNEEMSRNKIEAAKTNKLIKTQEKQIFSLESKLENQSNTINNLKESCKALKNEKSKLEKA